MSLNQCLKFLCTAQKQVELLLGRDRRVEIAANDYSETMKPKFKDVKIKSF